MTTTKVSELHRQLHDVLARSELWTSGLRSVPDLSGAAGVVGEDLGPELSHLRTRSASTLINVAMFGAFSSGKSFLVSGLQGHLEVVNTVGSDGLSAEMFIGLLPSSPEPTSACPARVTPVAESAEIDTSGSGFLRVRFTDSPEWEEIENSPAPARVAAYAMGSADVANRLPRDRRREVAEVEILLSSFELPAMLYDLPGHGSPIGIHDTIIKTAMNDADCFIYVTRANRTLSEQDLELIRELYIHCRAWKKQVIWVLTGIDDAKQLNIKKIPAWKTVIDTNNRYLAENFSINGQPDENFIGEGFIPVSAADEARAALSTAEGNSSAAGHYRGASNMESLRLVLRNFIEQQSGRKHVADIASTAQSKIAPVARAVRARFDEERLSVEDLRTLLAVQQESLRRVNAAIPALSRELEQNLRDRVNRTSVPFGQLASHLHFQLDARIRAADIRSGRKAHEIEVARTQVLQEWMDKEGGPVKLGDAQLEQFKQDIIGWVRVQLGTDELVGKLQSSSFSVENLDLSLQRAGRRVTQDIIGRTAKALGIATPIVTAGTATGVYFGTALGASIVFPPAAAIVAGVGLIYMSVQLFKKKFTSLELMQKEWIADLNSLAVLVRDRFKLTMGAQCTAMIYNAADSLESYRAQLTESMARLRERIAEPQYQMRQGFVDQLRPLSEEGESIVSALNQLSAVG